MKQVIPSQSVSPVKVFVLWILLGAAGCALAISCLGTASGLLTVSTLSPSDLATRQVVIATVTPITEQAPADIAERVRREKDIWGNRFSFEEYLTGFGDQIVVALNGDNGFTENRAFHLKKLLDDLYTWAWQYDPELITIITESKTRVVLGDRGYGTKYGGSANPTMFGTGSNTFRGIVFAQSVFNDPNLKGGNDGIIMEAFIHEVSRNYTSEIFHCAPGYYSDVDGHATEEMLSARIQPSMSPYDQEGMKSDLEWTKKYIDPTTRCR